jgi:hypothetical protein
MVMYVFSTSETPKLISRRAEGNAHLAGEASQLGPHP